MYACPLRAQVELRLLETGAFDALGVKNAFLSVHKAVLAVLDDAVRHDETGGDTVGAAYRAPSL